MKNQIEILKKAWAEATPPERRILERFPWLFKEIKDSFAHSPAGSGKVHMQEVADLILDSSKGDYNKVAFVQPLRPEFGSKSELTVVASAGYQRDMQGFVFPMKGSIAGAAYTLDSLRCIQDTKKPTSNEPQHYQVRGEIPTRSAVAGRIVDTYDNVLVPYAILTIDSIKPRMFSHTHKIGIRALIEDLQENHTLLETLTRDTLTGLHLRPRFMREYSAFLQRAMRTNQPLSVFYVDVDWLKSVNDGTAFNRTHPVPNHQLGDDLLKAIGRGCRYAMNRPDDLGGRIGGDEFVLALPGLTLEEAPRYQENHLLPKIEAKVRELEQNKPGRLYPRPLVSVGFVELQDFIKRDGDPEQLIQAADTLMYVEKEKHHAIIVKEQDSSPSHQ